MRKKILIILASLISFLAISTILFFTHKQDSTSMTKEEAIRQAEEYRPTKICTTVVTRGIHKATGAEHTFSSGCLPPGWE